MGVNVEKIPDSMKFADMIRMDMLEEKIAALERAVISLRDLEAVGYKISLKQSEQIKLLGKGMDLIAKVAGVTSE